jgi:hypothetical protein
MVAMRVGEKYTVYLSGIYPMLCACDDLDDDDDDA